MSSSEPDGIQQGGSVQISVWNLIQRLWIAIAKACFTGSDSLIEGT